MYNAPPEVFSGVGEWDLPEDVGQSFDIGVVVSFGYFLVSLCFVGYEKMITASSGIRIVVFVYPCVSFVGYDKYVNG